MTSIPPTSAILILNGLNKMTEVDILEHKPSSRLHPRILLVGDYMWPWYHEACARALESLGCEVARFGWFNDFSYWPPGQTEPAYHSLFHRVQYRFQSGPTVWNLKRRLLQKAKQYKPSVVWFYNVQIISPRVVQQLRDILPEAMFCQYANDNPFSKGARRGLWRLFLASIPLFDVHFSYRHGNFTDFKRFGAKEIYLLRSYFVPETDYPEPVEKVPDRFKCDVVFAGHYEDDGRIGMLEAVCDAGFNLKLYGGGWNAALPHLRASSPLRAKYPISPALEADYRYAICGAKVALCFLSTLNQDTYTRRNFQIPAMKTPMLSQYTADLAELFSADKEAMFFSDQKELLKNLNTLLSDNTLRTNVAHAGYKKVYEAGHDVRSRMTEWLEYVKQGGS